MWWLKKNNNKEKEKRFKMHRTEFSMGPWQQRCLHYRDHAAIKTDELELSKILFHFPVRFLEPGLCVSSI